MSEVQQVQKTGSRFLPPNEAAQHYQLSRKVLMRIADECGGLHRIGARIVRIDLDAVDNYIREH